MAKPRLGSGERFRRLKAKLGKKPGIHSPGALAAHIGRQKYGKARFQRLAAAGRANKGAKRMRKKRCA